MVILGWFQMAFVSCELPGKTFFTEEQCLDYTSPAMEVLFTASLSYFINDSLILGSTFGRGKQTRITYFHHALVSLGLLGCIFVGRMVGNIGANMLAFETSTIFLNIRYIMKSYGSDKTWIKSFTLNGTLLLVTFFLTRVLYFGILLFKYVFPFLKNMDYTEATESIGWVRVNCINVLLTLIIGLYCLNIFWFYAIVKGYLNYFRNGEDNEIEDAKKKKKRDSEDSDSDDESEHTIYSLLIKKFEHIKSIISSLFLL